MLPDSSRHSPTPLSAPRQDQSKQPAPSLREIPCGVHTPFCPSQTEIPIPLSDPPHSGYDSHIPFSQDCSWQW